MRLAALLTVAGATHFIKPRPYDAIVPRSGAGQVESVMIAAVHVDGPLASDPSVAA